MGGCGGWSTLEGSHSPSERSMLVGLTLIANASFYWFGGWFDVEPTHSDRTTDTLTHAPQREGGGYVWVWEVDVFRCTYVCACAHGRAEKVHLCMLV